MKLDEFASKTWTKHLKKRDKRLKEARIFTSENGEEEVNSMILLWEKKGFDIYSSCPWIDEIDEELLFHYAEMQIDESMKALKRKKPSEGTLREQIHLKWTFQNEKGPADDVFNPLILAGLMIREEGGFEEALKRFQKTSFAKEEFEIPLGYYIVSFIEYMDEGWFFDAHEAMELVWKELKKEKSPLASMARGLTNAAIAFEHIERKSKNAEEKAKKTMSAFERHKNVPLEGAKHANLFLECLEKVEKTIKKKKKYQKIFETN